jgi:hypothetical protein
MISAYNDKIHDMKIGTIDLETYQNGNEGIQEVYAGGCALNSGYKAFYYLDKNIVAGEEGGGSGDIIQLMFSDLFNYIAEDKRLRNRYTLYAHNLGRFDSVFLLKSLSRVGYKINCKWKDNDILSIKISDIERKLSIKILDSLKLIPTSLEKLLISFGCEINKGMFPHKFVNKDRLNYIGKKPDISFYLDEGIVNDSKVKVYDSLSDEFNLKEDCLEYLRKDVLGLLEAINKVSIHYFEEYKVNITKYATLPSLSLAIFGYWFYKDEDVHNSIKMIKGPLEDFIRQAYFGGNSDIFIDDGNRCVDNGFHYDMNSQYPYGMKQVMPTGNPVFSNNINLEYYKLGFVFAKITPPSKEVLPNLFIQQRNEDGSISCPRYPFYEYISTVDLRQGLDYGYNADVICGVNFPDARPAGTLFGEFVDTLYKEKRDALDSVKKITAKLILNSTYGKFGQKDKEYNIKLMNKNEADKIISKHHYNYFSEISEDLVLIKYGGRLNDKLRKLYIENNNNNLFINSKEDEEQLFAKYRGIPSAVQISAMISSHARFSINGLKNIPNNLAIASNTDSLILRHPLPDHLIGKELGQ